MLWVGLTGGIGSGKSAVAAIFASLGVEVIDADAVARDLTGRGGAALIPLKAVLGERFFTADGVPDRQLLREAVFADPELKKQLEDVLHPLIYQEIQKRKNNPAACCNYGIIEIPLLAEYPVFCRLTDRILVIDAPEEIRIGRVMCRNDWARDAVQTVMKQQAGRAERLALADDVIANTGSMERLRREVRRLHHRYQTLGSGQSA